SSDLLCVCLKDPCLFCGTCVFADVVQEQRILGDSLHLSRDDVLQLESPTQTISLSLLHTRTHTHANTDTHTHTHTHTHREQRTRRNSRMGGRGSDADGS